jgi:peptidoglycan/xylan/chitin deacetylase (PgdA/CDA1 family)
MLTSVLRPFARSGAILCYHGVATDDVRSPIHHTVSELASAVRTARRLGEVIPLKELVVRHRQGKNTAGLFAITFDDAYLSLQNAVDFFQREKVPVTVFAVPDALDEARRFWWDRLGAVLDRLTPEEMTVLSDRWRIPQGFRDTWLGTAWGPGRPLRQWVIARYAARWPAEFEGSLQELERAKRVGALDRSMTWEELERLVAAGPIDIGIHTRSHPAMPLLSADEQRLEITAGYDRLRERFPATIPVLAAPFGLFNRDTVAVTRELGLDACLGLGNRTLRFEGKTGALPRFCMMHPDSAFKLAPRLSGVVDQIRSWRGEGPPDFPVPPTFAEAVGSDVPATR